MKGDSVPVGGIGFFVAFISSKLPQMGTLVALVTILCLLPVMFRRWRNLVFDYYEFCTKNSRPRRLYLGGVFAFVFSSPVERAKDSDAPFSD